MTTYNLDQPSQRSGENSETALLSAFHKRELQLCLQPIVDLQSGICHRLEAHSFWRPVGSAGRYVDSDMLRLQDATSIQQFVYRNVQSVFAIQWSLTAQQIELPISLKIRAEHLSAGILDLLLASAREYNTSLSRIGLDIVDHPDQFLSEALMGRVSILKHKGVKIAMDSYLPTSHAERHLHKLPYDIIKLEKRLLDSPREATVLSTAEMVNYWRKRGQTIVFTGVDRFEDWVRIRRLTGISAQGHIVARPMSPGMLEGWLRNWRRASKLLCAQFGPGRVARTGMSLRIR